MTDVHDLKTRKYNMAQVKSKNTKPEILVRKFLYSKGIRYRIHSQSLPGKPDIIIPKNKTVIFVNGCFWHGHKNCIRAKLPKTRHKWWKDKIARTIIRDNLTVKQLKESNWNVFILWECSLSKAKRQDTLDNLLDQLKKVGSES